MANAEHLEILKKGASTWNRWRRDNLSLKPDLSGADLGRANLVEANLSGVDLSGTHLRRADLRTDLSGANLYEAELFGAILQQASLRGADVRWANLKWASLRGADLRAADLSGADLSRADLSEANFSEATVGDTTFANVDLSLVKGLETIKHKGPSTIGIETAYRWEGHVPERFLRGAGVPEPFVVNLKSLVGAMSPIEFYSCFISYSSKDQEFALRLYADLHFKRVRCWMAGEDLKIGDEFRQRVDDAIHFCDKLLVVLSESSVKSNWVEKEVLTALEKEKNGTLVLFPIRLDEAVMTTKEEWAGDIRRTRHIGDFRAWQDHNSYKRALDRLVRDLRGRTEARKGQ